MSKNFELIQQAGQATQLASMPAGSPMFSRTHEKSCTGRIRIGLGQVARGEILTLVQRIFLQDTQRAPRAVLFAGVDPGNACSQICLQVAEALASTVTGSVCLVEANFRSPSLPDLLGASNHYGLTDSLLTEGPIRSFARPLNLDNVWLLSCGSLTADSPNLLKSDRIRARFDELRNEFDYALVVAPSLTRYADAMALAPLTDGLVLLLEGNSTRKEVALQVIENLRAAQIQVLGAVLS
jgi:Mrp family chromosome partitioning ATPase